MRGIVELNLDHGRGLWDGNPEHGGLVVERRFVILVLVLGYVGLTQVDGERPGHALGLGS